jgi:hypothetical protein
MTKQEAHAFATELFEIAKGDPGPDPKKMLRVAIITGAFEDADEPSPHMKDAVAEIYKALQLWLSEGPWTDGHEVRLCRAAIMTALVKLRTDVETDL